MKKINRISHPSKGRKDQQMNHSNDSNDSLLTQTIDTFSDCTDLKQYSLKSKQVDFLYFEHLLDTKAMEQKVFEPIEEMQDEQALISYLENEQFDHVQTSEVITEKILEGYIAIFYKEHQVYMINVYGPETRAIEQSETESTILGNHDSFIESIDMNVSLVRRKLKSPKLKVIQIPVGEISRSTVTLMYVDGLVDQELLNTLKQKISDVEIDMVIDAHMFVQLIDDAPYAVFPQYFTTERPDIVAKNLCNGKVAGFFDQSPTAFLSPSNFFDFFHSPDDWSQRWSVSSATRLLRMLAFFITLTFTAFYVSVTTFHYEMIPEALLIALAESRSNVPFSPLLEALMMETTIELLREAGARLPTKIGQTIGIVGGIVIGQSAVQAGLVSNTLIIAVAISAIASFVMPSYMLSAAMRITRFGLIILAGFLGNYGLLIGIVFLLIQLSTLTNLSTPYFNPISPFHPKELLNSIIRAPYWTFSKRPLQTRTHNEDHIKSLGTKTNE